MLGGAAFYAVAALARARWPGRMAWHEDRPPLAWRSPSGARGARGFAYARPLTVLERPASCCCGFRASAARYAQAGPHRLRYLESGAGPPLVLVHGLGSNAMQDWGRLMAPLGRQLPRVRPGPAGLRPLRTAGRGRLRDPDAGRGRARLHGGRGRLEGARRRASRWAAGSPRASRASTRSSSSGWSWSRPRGCGPRRRPDPGRSPVPPRRGRRAPPGRHRPPQAARDASFLVRDVLARRLREEWIVRRTLESMAAGRDWLDGTLGRADMPVLIVWGKQDRLIPVAYAAPLQAEFPHAALELLDGCGHVPMADCPEAFDRELRPFLAGAEAPALCRAAGALDGRPTRACGGDRRTAASRPSRRPRGAGGRRSSPSAAPCPAARRRARPWRARSSS